MTSRLIESLSNSNWTVLKYDQAKIFQLLPSGIQRRLAGVPAVLRELILNYDVVANQTDTAWFVTYTDLTSQNENSFTWDECEKQSLDAADNPEDAQRVTDFWDRHFCFLMSVKNGYSHISVVTSGEGIGQVVWGSEPEYEEVSSLAGSVDECVEMLCDHLTGKRYNNVLQQLV